MWQDTYFTNHNVIILWEREGDRSNEKRITDKCLVWNAKRISVRKTTAVLQVMKKLLRCDAGKVTILKLEIFNFLKYNVLNKYHIILYAHHTQIKMFWYNRKWRWTYERLNGNQNYGIALINESSLHQKEIRTKAIHSKWISYLIITT